MQRFSFFRNVMKKAVIVHVIVAMLLTTISPVLAQSPAPAETQPLETAPVVINQEMTYSSLMRQVNELRAQPEARTEAALQAASDAIAAFVPQEQARLESLNVAPERIQAYIDLLQFLQNNLDYPIEALDNETLLLPPQPSAFDFDNSVIKVQPIQFQPENQLTSYHHKTWVETLKSWLVPTAHALIDTNDLPVLTDLQPGAIDTAFHQEIFDTVEQLEANPARIYDFVKQQVHYEPYFGAKKGAIGCLREKRCNDIDAASLTIALLRASGVPARYKKGIAVVSVEQLKNLLGVEENKTAYAALAKNKVPVFTMKGHAITDLDAADLTKDTHFAVQWVFAEAFIEYDERGGNYFNMVSFADAKTDAELQAKFANYGQMQWIPLDVIFKNYRHTKKDILVDTASFDVTSFWHNYFKYTGQLSPLAKFKADLEQKSQKKFGDYISTHIAVEPANEFIESVLPYQFGSAFTSNSTTIAVEKFSALPDSLRNQVKLTLKNASNQASVFSYTFYASEVNNQELTLSYQGKTTTDQSVIASYGGLHNTPVKLADVIPVITAHDFEKIGSTGISIGDQLILEVEHTVDNQVLARQQKFSHAGNTEGLYIVMSSVLVPDHIKTSEDIIFGGNTAIAREYLRRVETAAKEIAGSLDVAYNATFMMATISQSRILNKAQGTPTDFEMKGLGIDAMMSMTNYSRRGNYKSHHKDFTLLLGQHMSFEEGQLFDDLTPMQGISTTKGLQYAYQKPTEYTVHTITKNNKSVIDTLGFSATTKANMKTDVDAGNTIVTPNKPVTNQNWSGIFYTSLDLSGMGLYSIGEQVAGNGGFTVTKLGFANDAAVSENNKIVAYAEDRYSYTSGGYGYHFAEGLNYQRNCYISDKSAQRIKSLPDWKAQYGEPCRAETTLSFGDHQHSYLLGTRAARFTSPNKYNYWAYFSAAQGRIKDYIAQKKAVASSDINYLKGGEAYTIWFSTETGTWQQSICEKTGWIRRCSEYSTVYYVPDQQPHVYRVAGKNLAKLAEKNNTALRRLGWPTSDVGYAASSDVNGHKITGGTYQNFVNGQIYKFGMNIFNKNYNWGTYYTYGKITQEHNQKGGTSGSLGFPLEDPLEGLNNIIFQQFQGEQEIEWDKANNSVQAIPYKKFRCEIFGKKPSSPSYLLSGAADAVIREGLDSAEVIDYVNIAMNPFEALRSGVEITKEIIVAFGEIEFSNLPEFIKETTGSAFDSLNQQYQTSLGPQGCEARSMYLGGYLTTRASFWVIPVTKAVKAAKSFKLSTQIRKIVVQYQDFKKLLKERKKNKIDVSKKGNDNSTIKSKPDKDTENTIVEKVNLPTKKFFLNLKKIGAYTTPFNNYGRIVHFKRNNWINKRLKQAKNGTYPGLEKKGTVSNQKGAAGEHFLSDVLGIKVNNELHFPAKPLDKGGELVDGQKSRRRHDVYDDERDYCHEVKNLAYTTSFSQRDYDEIINDKALKAAGKCIPVWHFLAKSPMEHKVIRDKLEGAGIEYFIYIEREGFFTRIFNKLKFN